MGSVDFYLVSVNEAAGKDIIVDDPKAHKKLIKAAVALARKKTGHLAYLFASRDFDDKMHKDRRENYPDKVVFGKDNPGRLRSLLEQAHASQQEFISFYHGKLMDRYGREMPLDKLVDAISGEQHAQQSFNLSVMAQLLHGNYNIESGYYDTINNNAKLTVARINEIMSDPEDYALVIVPFRF